MPTAAKESETKPLRSMPATAKAPDIASASIPDTLAALHVNPATGLTHGDVEICRKEHGYNEVAEQKDGYAMVSCLVVNDAMKVILIKRLVPAAVA
jgi:Cation transporter/ATPase, N-terminus